MEFKYQSLSTFKNTQNDKSVRKPQKPTQLRNSQKHTQLQLKIKIIKDGLNWHKCWYEKILKNNQNFQQKFLQLEKKSRNQKLENQRFNKILQKLQNKKFNDDRFLYNLFQMTKSLVQNYKHEQLLFKYKIYQLNKYHERVLYELREGKNFIQPKDLNRKSLNQSSKYTQLQFQIKQIEDNIENLTRFQEITFKDYLALKSYCFQFQSKIRELEGRKPKIEQDIAKVAKKLKSMS